MTTKEGTAVTSIEALSQGVMTGDTDVTSIEEVFRQQYPSLWRLAAILVGDRNVAEELVMDAFARCLAGSGRHLGQGQMAPAYLRAAVVNRCRDHLRRRRLEWRVNAIHLSRTVAPVAAAEAEPEIIRAVRALPPGQRAAVVLTYFDDLSEADVAAALGVSKGTVKSQLSRARKSLAHTLADHREH